MNTQIVLFDHPAPLPVATLRSNSVADLASRLRGARHDGWRWFRPRAIPAIVAAVGMVAVLGAAEYLTRLARRTPVASTALAQSEPTDSPPAVSVAPTEISYGGTKILIDSNPAPAGTTFDVSPSSYRIVILRTEK